MERERGEGAGAGEVEGMERLGLEVVSVLARFHMQ